jgi:predicted kinase
LKEAFEDFIKINLVSPIFGITCGLPASFKTTVAEEISTLKGYLLLRSDIIRLSVLRDKDIFDPQVAGNMNNRLLVYEEMFRQAETLTAKKNSVILDATFVTQELRECAAQIAAKNGLVFVIFETHCSQRIALARIKNRSKEKYESNALTKEAYLANKNKFEPINIDTIKAKFPSLNILHLTINTNQCAISKWTIIKKTKR